MKLEELQSIAGDYPARLLVREVTRGELLALRLEWILIPCAGAPVLHFELEENNALAAVLMADLRNYWDRWKSTPDPVKRKAIAMQTRRTWARLVNLADGIRIPGARWYSWHKFAA